MLAYPLAQLRYGNGMGGWGYAVMILSTVVF
jgi:hypothetical protein